MTDKQLVIGVVGAGTMGRGIAQLVADAGHEVRLFDGLAGAAANARQFIDDMLQRSVEKKQRSAESAAATLNRIEICAGLGGLKKCAIVIEAIIEDLDAKHALFAQLEELVPASTILATNTSSLVVAEIAAGSKVPERFAGLHFFNPVPLMKVVEIIAAVRTAPETVAALRELVISTGHRAVVAIDQPGFLVNHAGRGLPTEGLRVVEEQIASPVDVDVLMREAAGFRMGPFELLDLTGLDVSSRVMQSIYDQFQQEPRFRPSALVAPRVAAGLFGRKTGAGWYQYGDDGKPKLPAAAPIPALPAGLSIWIDPAAANRDDIAALAEGITIAAAADKADLLIVQPWGTDATGYCVAQGLDATRTVALDPLPGLQRRRCLMLTAVTTTAARDAALALFGRGDAKVTVINDSPGFVVQRILATIVNIAANIAQRGIASVADIEDAVKLGLGYPQGPLALGDSLGSRRVLTILRNMFACTGDARYRPSLWLVRRAELGISLLTPEAARAGVD